MRLRLNLGSGGRNDEGWTHVDREFSVDQRASTHIRLDIARDPWPWEDGSVEGIVMHHVADLLTADELTGVLRRCYAVLKPGGVLRVSCADVTRGIERAMAGDWSWFAEPRMVSDERFGAGVGPRRTIDPDFTLGHFILQGGARKQYLAGAWVDSLLLGAGFSTSASRVACGATFTDKPWITELDSRPDESWFVEAVR